MKKDIYLGTANWGEKTTKREAFAILDEFFKSGINLIDTATNYPINGRNSNFGLAILWLGEWQKMNSATEMKVFVKIGSVNNYRDDKIDLTPKHILKIYDHLQNIFGSNLYGMGIHWDNRNEDCYEEILETILTLKNLQKWGVRLGISGIKYPALYYKTAEIGSDWLIQVKEFPGHTFGRQEYCKYFANNPYIAYGLSHFINQGFELNRRIIKESYFIGLDYLAKNGSLQGFIVAPSSLSQAKELLNYFQNL